MKDSGAAFSPDGKLIATGDKDGAVSLWEVASAGRVRRRLPGHAAAVSGVSFHPDGSRLVSLRGFSVATARASDQYACCVVASATMAGVGGSAKRRRAQ